MTEPPEEDKSMPPIPEARSLPWSLQIVWYKTKVFIVNSIFHWGFESLHHFLKVNTLTPFSNAILDGEPLQKW